MSLVYVEDTGGAKMELVDVDGYYVCTFLRSAEEIGRAVRGMKTFPCRPDDIFVCAPMKSGTHWVWEMISMLVNGKAESIPKSKVKNMLEAKPFEDFENLPSPRVLNTHVDFEYLPADVQKLKCKIVFVLRNPKDVIVSHYNHVIGCKAYKYDGKWENFYRLYVEGKIEYNGWFEYVREWYNIIQTRKDLNIHVVYYEDLKQNTLQEITRIAEFLKIENKNGLFEAITRTCQFDQMAKNKDAAITPEDREMIFNGDFNMYRKGEHGDWTNWFTVAQSEHFDKIFKERMAGVDFNFRFLPDK